MSSDKPEQQSDPDFVIGGPGGSSTDSAPPPHSGTPPPIDPPLKHIDIAIDDLVISKVTVMRRRNSVSTVAQITVNANTTITVNGKPA